MHIQGGGDLNGLYWAGAVCFITWQHSLTAATNLMTMSLISSELTMYAWASDSGPSSWIRD